MGKTITKTVTQALMCRLTEAELEEESRKLTDFLLEKATLEVEKSASNKHYSDRIKAVDVRIEKQIPVVRDREIEREVECRVEYNVPEKGLKRVTRLDTNEVVETSEMTSDECQDLFLNAPEAENAPEVPAVKALPAPADENVIDAEEVIHVDVDETEEITPEPNKLYEVNGKLVRAVEAPYANCESCILDHDDDSCNCFLCDNIIFRTPYEENSPANGESSEPNGESCLPPYEESNPDRPACSKCGHNPGQLFHVDNEKLMCEYCMENTASAKKAAAFLAENHQQFGVRASFGYGCRREVADATCFRLRPLGSDHSVTEGGAVSWGMHHYKAGDYRQEGTPAHEYYQHLLSIGGVEA